MEPKLIISWCMWMSGSELYLTLPLGEDYLRRPGWTRKWVWLSARWSLNFFFFPFLVRVCVCVHPVKGLGMSIFMLLSSFSFGSAYAANLAFMIISTLSSAGGSLGIFRQKWLNWISAQTQCLNGFMDGINWAAAKESHIYVFEL